MSNNALVEKMLASASKEKIQNISYMDRYLSKYSKALFDDGFFEEIVLYDFDGPNLAYHYFAANNKESGCTLVPVTVNNV